MVMFSYKILIILIVVVLGFMVLFTGLWFNSKPEHKMIEVAYFICQRCNSADGGIYGKGPFKSFRSNKARWCHHNWEKVSRQDFKTFATQHFNVDWDKEIPFWSRNDSGNN